MARRKKTEEGQLKTSGEVKSKKAKNAEPRLANSSLRQEAITATFGRVLEIDQRIEALMLKHIQPLKDQRTEEWRTLKADTGIQFTDANLLYKLYKRAELAKDMDEEADRDRILDNLREVFESLKAGEQLDWLDGVTERSEEEEEPAGAEAAPDFERMTNEQAEKAGYEAGHAGHVGEPPEGYSDYPTLHKAWLRGWRKRADEFAESHAAKNAKRGGAAGVTIQ